MVGPYGQQLMQHKDFEQFQLQNVVSANVVKGLKQDFSYI